MLIANVSSLYLTMLEIGNVLVLNVLLTLGTQLLFSLGDKALEFLDVIIHSVFFIILNYNFNRKTEFV